jgi:hypothetical protein
MCEVKRDYEIGYGKPPRGRPFQGGHSGNPCGPRRGPVVAAGRRAERAGLRHDRRRAAQITKREAIVTQMVNESAKANLRATKMLFDMMKEVEQKAGAAPPEPAKLTAADKEVVELFVARLRRQIAAEAAEAAEAAAAPFAMNWHVEVTAGKLMAVREGRIRRLIICVPPRHLKSLLASVAFPAWCLGHDPSARSSAPVMRRTSADKLSRDCRHIVTSGSSRPASRHGIRRCRSSKRQPRAAGSPPRSAAC